MATQVLPSLIMAPPGNGPGSTGLFFLRHTLRGKACDNFKYSGLLTIRELMAIRVLMRNYLRRPNLALRRCTT
jgi:hypothetical protein